MQPDEDQPVEAVASTEPASAEAGKKTEQPAPAETSAAQKSTVQKSGDKTPAKTADVKKAETTVPSKSTTQKEPAKVVEPAKPVTTTAPPPAKKEEPVSPKSTEPVVEKPKAPSQPTAIESPKAEETKKEPTTQPGPKPVPQTSTWTVPESANSKTNPVKADKNSIAAGKTLWTKHCASCHGKSGLGDGPKAAQLDTNSGDFTSAAFQKQTDGALFYKTDEGKGDMPAFKKKIPDDEDVWNLVNYMRIFK